MVWFVGFEDKNYSGSFPRIGDDLRDQQRFIMLATYAIPFGPRCFTDTGPSAFEFFVESTALLTSSSVKVSVCSSLVIACSFLNVDLCCLVNHHGKVLVEGTNIFGRRIRVFLTYILFISIRTRMDCHVILFVNR